MTMTDTQGKNADRRAQRSIRLLKEAFFELMREKGFSSITIQDIADRADVGRGTFYAHFPDKYALLETAIREKFHRLLDSRLPPAASWEKSHLHLLILTVLEHFKEMYGRCYPVDTVNPLFEQAVQEELSGLFLQWLEQLPESEARLSAPSGTMALMMSWAVFGAAAEWSKGKSALSAERMADHVLAVITEGAFRLVPGDAPAEPGSE